MERSEKISHLFEERYRIALLESVEPDHRKRKDFLQDLLCLQDAIYQLDAILEAEWNVDMRLIDAAWKHIYEALKAFKTSNEIDDMVADIKAYQSHELGQRNELSVSEIKADSFYFTKSCDVRLMRELIFENYPSLYESYRLEDWKTYDIITEIRDDVDDLEEDRGTYNGNRFMKYLEENGIPDTKSHYYALVIYQFKQFELEEKTGKINPEIAHQTVQACKDLISNMNQCFQMLEQESGYHMMRGDRTHI